MSRLLNLPHKPSGVDHPPRAPEIGHYPYLFEDVPRRKILNAALTEGSVYFKPLYPWGWPSHLRDRTGGALQPEMLLCPVTTGMKRPQGLMAFETFTKILDEVGDHIFTLLFWGWGEPFLNPRAFDMIAYTRAKGVKVISSTNGHLFARQEYADRLVRSGLDSIIFAIDGVTQASYERFRHGGHLETVLQGIRNVADRKKALGPGLPSSTSALLSWPRMRLRSLWLKTGAVGGS